MKQMLGQNREKSQLIHTHSSVFQPPAFFFGAKNGHLHVLRSFAQRHTLEFQGIFPIDSHSFIASAGRRLVPDPSPDPGIVMEEPRNKHGMVMIVINTISLSSSSSLFSAPHFLQYSYL